MDERNCSNFGATLPLGDRDASARPAEYAATWRFPGQKRLDVWKDALPLPAAQAAG